MATDVNGVVLGAIPAGVPHLAIPFTISQDGTVAVLDQDSTPEIIQSVAMLVGSRPGERLMVPSYGVPDPTFVGINRTELLGAVNRWESRATVAVTITPANAEQVVVGVKKGST